MTTVRLKTCQKCQGDLVLSADDWRCFQCGTYYYQPCGKDLVSEVKECREAPTINVIIEAFRRSELKWWKKNKELIDYFKQGTSINEIADLFGKSPRTIRTARERYYDNVAFFLEYGRWFEVESFS